MDIFVVYCLEQDSYFYHYNLERSHKFISFFLPEQIESLKDTGSGVPQGVLRDGENPQKPSLPYPLRQTKHSNWWKEGRKAEIRE